MPNAALSLLAAHAQQVLLQFSHSNYCMMRVQLSVRICGVEPSEARSCLMLALRALGDMKSSHKTLIN